MDIDSLLQKYADGLCSTDEDRAIKNWLSQHIADPTYDTVFEKLLEATPVSTDIVHMKAIWRRVERQIGYENEKQKQDRKTRWTPCHSREINPPLNEISLFMTDSSNNYEVRP